jgi:hypothetical protein
MTDDGYSRPYRGGHDPYGRPAPNHHSGPQHAPAPAPAPGQGDPLSELARLIGQPEQPPQPQQQQWQQGAYDPYQYPSGQPDPRFATQGDPRFGNQPDPRFASQPDPRFNSQNDPRYGNAAAGYPENYADPYQAPTHHTQFDPPPLPSGGYGEQPFRSDTFQSDRFDGDAFRGDTFQPETYRPGYEPPIYAQGAEQNYSPPYYGDDDHSRDHEHHGDHHHDQHDDLDYDEQHAPTGRSGLVTVAAVFCLAVAGTAGAFAYRALTSGGSSNPPVILADAAPTKIVPAQPDSSMQADRPDFSQPERVVSREERPVNVQTTSGPPPRIVFGDGPSAPPPIPPSASAMAPVPTTPSPPPAAAPPAPPRKVHTVVIKPGQDDTLAQSPRVASSGVIGSDGDAPLSLSPQIAPTPTEPHRLASTTSRPAPPPSPAPSATAAATALPSGASAGSFFVQVSAQKSEDEAQAAFRAMQAKYAEQLSGRQPVIRRKDLGDKGIFFAAQVGPFASHDEAVQLCESLKSAGGSCMIQKN